jgi:hypothetical protein
VPLRGRVRADRILLRIEDMKQFSSPEAEWKVPEFEFEEFEVEILQGRTSSVFITSNPSR